MSDYTVIQTSLVSGIQVLLPCNNILSHLVSRLLPCQPTRLLHHFLAKMSGSSISTYLQSFSDGTSRRTKDDTLKSHKETLQQRQTGAEQNLTKQQKQFIDLELRKFRRRKLLQLHELQQDLLREVSCHEFMLWVDICFVC